MRLLVLAALVCGLVSCRRTGEVVGSAVGDFSEGVSKELTPRIQESVSGSVDRQLKELERKQYERKMADPNHNPYWDSSKGRR